MSLAIIFNGQGAHYREMGQDFAEQFSEAETVYKKVEKITKYPIRDIIKEDIKLLTETRYAQVAIAATSLAIYKSIEKQLPEISFMAGLSLGEYSSLIASGMLKFEEGLGLLKKRGQLMSQQCQVLNDSADIVMEVVLGMPLAEVEKVITEVNQINEELYIANLNSSQQIIITGTQSAVDQFKEIARKKGYKKMMPLKVEGPFHSPYMVAVCDSYTEVLEDITLHEKQIPVISNTTVKPHTVSEAKDLLVRHLTEPVRWEETIQYMVDHGVTKIIQIGPGKTLANLLKREPNAPETIVIDKVEDLEQLEEFIGGMEVDRSSFSHRELSRNWFRNRKTLSQNRLSSGLEWSK